MITVVIAVIVVHLHQVEMKVVHLLNPEKAIAQILIQVLAHQNLEDKVQEADHLNQVEEVAVAEMKVEAESLAVLHRQVRQEINKKDIEKSMSFLYAIFVSIHKIWYNLYMYWVNNPVVEAIIL